MSSPKPIPTVRYTGPIDGSGSGAVQWGSDDDYENFTFIDWGKESHIKPTTHSGSKKWTVLAGMSLAVGYTAIFIDLASVWLNDLKKGLCLSKLDRWSLLNPYSTCPAEDWYDWSKLLAGTDSTVAKVLVNFPIYTIFILLFVLVASWITIKKAPLLKQSGIPEMKLIIAGFNYYMDTYLGPKVLVYKIAGLILVVSSGLWLGKEGPLVHVACCLLTIFYSRVYGTDSTEGLRRELLSAAVATGIAVAFNSPIGGVLFVVELLPSYFTPTKIMWNSFVSATIALVVLYGFKVFTEGKDYHDEVLFEVSFGNFSWLFMESIPFMFLGLMGGLYGFTYTKLYLRFADKGRKKRLWAKIAHLLHITEFKAQFVEVAVIALFSAAVTFPLSMTKMPLSAFLKLLFTDCPSETSSASKNSSNFLCGSSSVSTSFELLYIFVQGFILSAYSYGLSLPGGVLMPSLVLGGTMGRFVGIVSLAIQSRLDASYLATCTAKSCIVSPSSYAVVGAAAFMTGLTRLTLSVVVIIFELTGAVTYVLPIMVAVMTARFFSDWICRENIYDAWLNLEFNGQSTNTSELNSGKGHGLCNFSSIPGRFTSKLPDLPISSVMIPFSKMRHLELFPKQPYYLAELYAFLSDDNHEGYPLVASDSNPITIGYLPKQVIFKTMLQTIGNTQDRSLPVCFQAKVPIFLEQERSKFEATFAQNYPRLQFVPITVEGSPILVKSSAPLKQVIEMFERLHLNFLLVTDKSSNVRMGGFIDRFTLSRIIHSGFDELQQHVREISIASEFEIADEDEDDSFTVHNPESFELLT